MTTTTLQTAALRSLEESEDAYQARWWSAREAAKDRLYLELGRRDASAFVEFDDATRLEGARLRVTLKDCGQTTRWYASQAKKIAVWAFPALVSVVALVDPDRAAALRKEFDETSEDLRGALVHYEVKP